MDDNSLVMPVTPMYGGYGGGFGGLGSFGADGLWIILLLFALMGNGFGGWGGFGGMFGMGMMDGGFGLYPWLNNSQNINGGFRDQMLNTSINGIQNAVTSGFGDVQTALCGGFAGVNQNICQAGNNVVSAVNNAKSDVTAQLYNNEIASLNRSFAEQTANTQGFNGVQAGLCDNRYANAQNTRDIIAAITSGVQSIKDDICADRLANAQREVEAERRENANLRSQLQMSNFANALNAGFTNEVDALYNRLKNCPVGTVPVYGNQPVFTCNNGCGGNFAYAA